jgi:hypothetical protein
MSLDVWWLLAITLGVIVYIALPVAMAVVYLSRVNAALARRKPTNDE